MALQPPYVLWRLDERGAVDFRNRLLSRPLLVGHRGQPSIPLLDHFLRSLRSVSEKGQGRLDIGRHGGSPQLRGAGHHEPDDHLFYAVVIGELGPAD